MRLSLCEEALAGSILHPPPSLWFCVGSFRLCGPGAGQGWGPEKGGYHLGGGGVEARGPESIHLGSRQRGEAVHGLFDEPQTFLVGLFGHALSHQAQTS